jgi:thiaminase II
MGGFFAELCARNAETHERVLAHPAVSAIAESRLGDARFRFYLAQDYLFLREYIRVIAFAIAAAREQEHVGWLADLLHGTVHVEMDAVRTLHAAFGGADSAIDSAVAQPACRAYTDHLIAQATSANLTMILASLLPCQWGYREIARAIEARGTPSDGRYAGWVHEYLSPAYSALVDRMIATFDSEAACEGPRTREFAARTFAASSDHELRFWDMVMQHEVTS